MSETIYILYYTENTYEAKTVNVKAFKNYKDADITADIENIKQKDIYEEHRVYYGVEEIELE